MTAGSEPFDLKEFIQPARRFDTRRNKHYFVVRAYPGAKASCQDARIRGSAPSLVTNLSPEDLQTGLALRDREYPDRPVVLDTAVDLVGQPANVNTHLLRERNPQAHRKLGWRKPLRNNAPTTWRIRAMAGAATASLTPKR